MAEEGGGGAVSVGAASSVEAGAESVFGTVV
jgi:hypothetical protein